MRVPSWMWMCAAALLAGAAIFMVVRGGDDQEGGDESEEVSDRSGAGDRRPGTHSRQRRLDPAAALRRFEDVLAEWQEHVKGPVPPKDLPDGLEERMRAAIRGLAVDDLRRLYREWSLDDQAVAENQYLLPQVIEAWAKAAPEKAWAAVEERFALGPIDHHAAAMISAALGGWSKRDPLAASEVYLAYIGIGEDRAGGSGDYCERLGKTIFENLAARDPDAAWSALARIPAAASYTQAVQGYYAGLPGGWDWRMEADRFSQIPQFAGMSSAMAGEGERSVGDYPRGDWDFRAQGALGLAQRWMLVEPAEAMGWYVHSTPYLSGGSKAQVVYCQQQRVKRASELLAPFYREQPRAAVKWMREQPWEWEHSEYIPLSVLHAVPTPTAAADLLPLISAESQRYSFVLQRARKWGMARTAVARNPDSEDWTPEDVRSILPAANLNATQQRQIEALMERATSGSGKAR